MLFLNVDLMYIALMIDVWKKGLGGGLEFEILIILVIKCYWNIELNRIWLQLC